MIYEILDTGHLFCPLPHDGLMMECSFMSFFLSDKRSFGIENAERILVENADIQSKALYLPFITPLRYISTNDVSNVKRF